ncbi:MAG: cysteine desulfurase family protein, partial [Methanomassiliicoccales archaeon]
ELIDDNTLVSVQHANQEVGTVQDVAAVADICEDEGSLFHTDATHTFGRLLLDLSSLRADMVTMAAHTVHGPKGIGALYLRDGTPMGKWMDGGFQENDRRAGLENIPGAVGFARAVELIDREENVRLASMRDRVIDRVLGEVPHTTLNGGREGIPQNANLTFHYVEGGSITLHLDMRGFAVSTGSACFSKSLEASHVIMAMGGDHERAHGSIRFTFGRFNTMEEADAVVDAVSEVVHRLREISPLGKEVEE